MEPGEAGLRTAANRSADYCAACHATSFVPESKDPRTFLTVSARPGPAAAPRGGSGTEEGPRLASGSRTTQQSPKLCGGRLRPHGGAAVLGFVLVPRRRRQAFPEPTGRSAPTSWRRLTRPVQVHTHLLRARRGPQVGATCLSPPAGCPGSLPAAPLLAGKAPRGATALKRGVWCRPGGRGHGSPGRRHGGRCRSHCS